MSDFPKFGPGGNADSFYKDGKKARCRHPHGSKRLVLMPMNTRPAAA